MPTDRRIGGVSGGGAAFVKANTQGEYATVAVGTPTQDNHAINMGYLLGEAVADQPTQNHQIANKEYVDVCTSKCVQAVASPNGVLKAYLQNGNKQDACVVSNDGSASSIARYTAKGHLIDQSAPQRIITSQTSSMLIPRWLRQAETYPTT